MVTRDLSIVATSTAQHKPVAWLIRGADPADWLATLAAFGGALDAVRLLPLPHGPDDPRPAAVIAVGLPAPAAPIANALPYGCLGELLYLPVHSRLEPAVTDDELRALLDWDYAVIHPTLGLYGYQQDDVLTVAGLLAPPPATPHLWQSAQPGIIMNHRLTSIEPSDTPGADDIIAEGRDGIGTEDGADLPAAPGETSPSALGRLGAGMHRAVSGGINKIRGAMSGGGGAGGSAGSDGTGGGTPPKPGKSDKSWLDSLESWSESTLGKLGGGEGESAMAKQARRLLHMLERDPEQGLKHAMPVNGGAHRGVAGGAQDLASHGTDFDIGRLGGGAAAPWALPWELFQDLQRRYRELARRELSLGRHRRAAYIYAELLGDYGAAANVLQQGGHHREAAVLYRDYLRQPLRAARCLEEGGFLLEAIRLYEAEGYHETTGDLYARLDRHADAQAAWRQAVVRFQETGDPLGAARLLEQKVGAPDEALAVLAAAWPYRSQAGECLQEQFSLLGRLSRHHHAADLLGSLRADLPPRTPVTLAECLSHVTTSYPDTAIRQEAADLARIVVGQRLEDSGYEESRMLLNALQRTEPSDRLLARDIGRYRDQKRLQRVSMRKPLTPSRENPHLLARHQLPVSHVMAATARRDGFFAAGRSDSGEFVLARGSWQGLWQSTYWRPDDLPSSISLILDAGHYESQPVILADRSRPALAPQSFPLADGFAQAVPVGTPAWFTRQMIAVTQGHHHVIWVLTFDQVAPAITLDTYSIDGHLITSRPIELSDPTMVSRYPVSLTAVRNCVYLAVGPLIYEIADEVRLIHEPFDDPIYHVATSAPYTRQRLVISHAHGGGIIWPTRHDIHYEPVATSMIQPHLAFTRSGALVAVSGQHGEVYDTNQTAATRTLDFTLPGEPAVAIAPGPGATEFVVFDRHGGVAHYRLDPD